MVLRDASASKNSNPDYWVLEEKNRFWVKIETPVVDAAKSTVPFPSN